MLNYLFGKGNNYNNNLNSELDISMKIDNMNNPISNPADNSVDNPIDNSVVDSVVDSNNKLYDITVSVAESVTAGAITNILGAKPGSSLYFKGGIFTCSIASKKDILNINIEYAEKNNFANPFTTMEMAKSVAKLFNTRYGISTTGYSLPIQRKENLNTGECELNIETPYAYICLYDSYTHDEVIIKKEFDYDKNKSSTKQRAMMQVSTANIAIELYNERIKKISK